MFQFRQKCPRCRNYADFAVLHVAELNVSDLDEIKSWNEQYRHAGHQPARMSALMQKPQTPVEAVAIANCPLCKRPLMIDFRTNYRGYSQIQESYKTANTRVKIDKFEIVATYPKLDEPSQNPAWPQKVQKPFADLQRMTQENTAPSLIIAGCRGVLEVCLNEKQVAGKNLATKIDNARQQGLITQSLAEWSHALRLDGNEAIHEFLGTNEEARQLVEFVQLFLEIVFVLPRSIESRKSAKLTNEADIQSPEIKQ